MTQRLPRGPLLLALLALAGQGCSRSYASLSPAQVCTSDQALGRIRSALFDQATAQASSQTRYALDALKPQVQAKLVRPLVESYDHDTRKTTCTADLDVWLPAGVASPRELQSPIRYESQPTADGRDVVLNVSGLEQVASGVAGADLSAWADAHAPRKPSLVVEVVPRSPGAPTYAEATARPTPRPPGDTERPSSNLPPPGPSTPQGAPPRSPAQDGPPARAGVAAPEPGGDGAVRVFVHVLDASELPDADRLRAALARLTIGGAPVATPAVRFVADMPRRTEVRCLKRADCFAARQVAGYLAEQMGVSVAVVDMSSTYETDRGVRPGSLELWLRPSAS